MDYFSRINRFFLFAVSAISLCCTCNQKVASQLSEELKLPRIRLSMGGGLSQTLEKTPESEFEAMTNYINELKSGYSYGADFSYFFFESMGVGLKCNGVIRSNSLNNVELPNQSNYSGQTNGSYLSVDANTNRTMIDLSNHIAQFYVGPTLNFRKFGTEKHTFYVSASAGYSGLRNRTFFASRNVSDGSTITSSTQRFVRYGSTLGSSIGVGYDYSLSRKVALCMNLSLTNGVLRKITIDNGVQINHYALNREEYISLNHIDLSVGFSFVR